MNVTDVIQAMTMQILHPNASPVIKQIITLQPIPIILQLNSPLNVWNAIQPGQIGNQPISRCMMLSFSRYSQENIRANGTNVAIAIPTRVTMLFLPASIVMSITGQIWMISIPEKEIISITVWPVWIATQQGVTNKDLI